jgi:acetophenone carboxylase
MTYVGKQISGTYEADKYPSPPRLVHEYDVVAGGTAGGGGYGDPIDRDPSLVMQDLEDGIISHRVARDVYRVAYNEESLLVDEEKTRMLREQERLDRKTRGVRFEVFEKEWLQLKPDEEILEFYGEWPETRYKSFTYYGSWHD